MTTDVTDVGSVNAANQDAMKAAQVAEAANRQAPVVEVVDGIGEDSHVSDRSNQAELADTGVDPTQPRRPVFFGDEARNQIAANFRRNRDAKASQQTPEQEAAEDAAEIQAFVLNGGVPRELSEVFVDDQPTDTGEQPVQETQRPVTHEPPAPRKYKIKVLGQEREVDEAELIAMAQKSAAGDDYLTEARNALHEVKALRADLEARNSNAGANQPGDNAGTQDGQPNQDGDPNQVDPFQETAETLLYGDPQTAGAKLRELVTTVVPRIAQQTNEADRRRTEHSRSMATVDRFKRENEDLAKDSMASAAVEMKIYEHQRQDLIDLGLDPNKLPPDFKSIANMHLTFRSDPNFSGRVRTSDQLFDAAKSDYLKWRGVDSIGDPSRVRANQQQDPPAQRQDHVVQVSVDRDDRRRAIPQQPTRPAVLQRAAQQAPQPRTRSDVIAEMRRARGQA